MTQTELPDDLKALQFVSNLISLEPGKKYLLVIRGIDMSHYERFQLVEALHRFGIDCLSLSLPEGANLDVIGIPTSEESKS